MVESHEESYVVFDNGSNSMRAGIAGEEQPALSIPTIVGKPKPGSGLEAESYFGDDIAGVKSQLDLRRLIH